MPQSLLQAIIDVLTELLPDEKLNHVWADGKMSLRVEKPLTPTTADIIRALEQHAPHGKPYFVLDDEPMRLHIITGEAAKTILKRKIMLVEGKT